MKDVSLTQLLDILGPDVARVSQGDAFSFFGAGSIDRPKPGHLSFCSASLPRSQSLISRSRASIIICRDEDLLPNGATLVHVANPRLAFVRALRSFVAEPRAATISPDARLHPQAILESGVAIAAGCVVGKSEIGQGSTLLSNVVVHDGVKIGRNCLIKSGSVIGGEGFGFEVNAHGIWEKFHHLGDVTIEDDVEIGSNCAIDQGALGPTVVGRGTKIDSLVHIAHNVRIGRNCIIASSVNIAGSTRVGDSVWISPAATLINGIEIGNRAFIGMGAVVAVSVPDDHRVTPSTSVLKNSRPKPAE